MAYRDLRVLVTVGEEAWLSPLLTFACALAETQQGTLTFLTVSSIRSAALTTAVQEALVADVGQMEEIELYAWDIVSGSEPTLHLQVQVQAAREIPRQARPLDPWQTER